MSNLLNSGGKLSPVVEVGAVGGKVEKYKAAIRDVPLSGPRKSRGSARLGHGPSSPSVFERKSIVVKSKAAKGLLPEEQNSTSAWVPYKAGEPSSVRSDRASKQKTPKSIRTSAVSAGDVDKIREKQRTGSWVSDNDLLPTKESVVNVIYDLTEDEEKQPHQRHISRGKIGSTKPSDAPIVLKKVSLSALSSSSVVKPGDKKPALENLASKSTPANHKEKTAAAAKLGAEKAKNIKNAKESLAGTMSEEALKMAYVDDKAQKELDNQAADSVQALNTIRPEEEIADKIFTWEKLDELKMTPDYWHEGTPHVVALSLKVYYINNIDTVAQTFDAGLYINHEWQPSKQDIEKWKQLKRLGKESEFVPSFLPAIRLTNCLRWDLCEVEAGLDGCEYSMLRSGERDSRGTLVNMKQDYMIYMRKNYRATFAEPFELNSFPFDVQDLKIVMRSIASSQKQILVPSMRETTFGHIVLDISSLPDWEFMTAAAEFSMSDQKLSIGGQQYSNFTLNLKVSRDYAAYLVRVYLIMAMISGSMFCIFSLDAEDDAADRQANAFSLLLTALVFMFVVAAQLPNVPYLTALDKYVYSMLGFMLLIAMECSLIRLFTNPQHWDKIAMFTFIGVFVLLHIYFAYDGFILRGREMWKVFLTSKDAEELEDMDFGNKNNFYLDSDGLQEFKKDYWARIDNTSTKAQTMNANGMIEGGIANESCSSLSGFGGRKDRWRMKKRSNQNKRDKMAKIKAMRKQRAGAHHDMVEERENERTYHY